MKRHIQVLILALCALSSADSGLCASAKKQTTSIADDPRCKRLSEQELAKLSDINLATYKLTERFLDAKDNKLSWTCFATLLAFLANKDARYRLLVAPSNNSIRIGSELEQFLDRMRMPPAARGLIKCYTRTELLKLLDKRIALNNKHLPCNPRKILNIENEAPHYEKPSETLVVQKFHNDTQHNDTKHDEL